MVPGQHCPFKLAPRILGHRSNNTRLVKHYSPACHHCKKTAPAYQTTYEFYYVGLLGAGVILSTG